MYLTYWQEKKKEKKEKEIKINWTGAYANLHLEKYFCCRIFHVPNTQGTVKWKYSLCLALETFPKHFTFAIIHIILSLLYKNKYNTVCWLDGWQRKNTNYPEIPKGEHKLFVCIYFITA